MIRTQVGILALLVGGLFATDAQAFGRRGGGHACYTPCYTPCWIDCCPTPCWPPCCQPDETPIKPPHPCPKQTAAKLTLDPNSPAEFFVILYVKCYHPCYPCGVYHQYRKFDIPAGGAPVVVSAPADPLFVGDEILVETWWRTDPKGCWNCWCNKAFTLHEPTGTYNLRTCHYTHP